MANKFIEKHKKKSLWALLLLLFRGRNKYIALLVVVMLLSIPFVATSDMMERFLNLSSVRSMLSSLGLERVVASLTHNNKYSGDFLKSTFSDLKAEYEANNLWNKVTGGMDSRGGEDGTIAFVRFGEDFLNYGKNKKSKNGKNSEISDYISKDDSENGMGADGVDLNNPGPDSYGNGMGVDGIGGMGSANGRLKSSLFANGIGSGMFGSNMMNGGSHNAGGSGGYGPYINRKDFNGKGGSGYGGKSIASSALDDIKKTVPDAKDPKGGSKVKKMGKLTAFGWKNVGYTKKGANIDVSVTGNRRALFQMGETLATTSMAYKQNPAYEYQAAYTGATYDGNTMNGDIVVTDPEINTTVPDTAYVSDVVDSAQHWEEIAKECSDAQATNGTRISELQKEMDDISKTMGKPPKCCKNVGPWNSKVSRLVSLCNELNSNSVALSQKCGGSTPQTINCQQSYGKLHIKPCSKWKCWLGIILAIVGLLVGFLMGGFLGAIIGAVVGFAVGSIGSMYLQMMAMASAFAGAGAYFADKGSEKAINVTEEVNKDVADENK
ncbi:MAG: DUF456 domain-containing protein [Elusimicrobia bacterium]|jgi:hypothetical protein|nr:DUF456 domain-containing protein [Elusimicrobiota bacterium]